MRRRIGPPGVSRSGATDCTSLRTSIWPPPLGQSFAILGVTRLCLWCPRALLIYRALSSTVVSSAHRDNVSIALSAAYCPGVPAATVLSHMRVATSLDTACSRGASSAQRSNDARTCAVAAVSVLCTCGMAYFPFPCTLARNNRSSAARVARAANARQQTGRPAARQFESARASRGRLAAHNCY